MSKIKVGDIFEIKTAEGKAYLHYTGKDDTVGELIRVLPGLYTDRPANLEELAGAEEQYMVYFPLLAASKRKIVERVGYYPADNFKKPQYMRSKHVVKGEFLGWHIIDTSTWQRELVKTLTDEQMKLSPWGIWNDTLLVENLLDGWSLEEWY